MIPKGTSTRENTTPDNIQQLNGERAEIARTTTLTAELVTYDPDDTSTYPSVCNVPTDVEARFGFVGGETLVFDERGSYVGQLVKQMINEARNAKSNP